jgi:hypothetical protein
MFGNACLAALPLAKTPRLEGVTDEASFRGVYQGAGQAPNSLKMPVIALETASTALAY